MSKYILELTEDILSINYDDLIPLFFANYSSKNKKVFDNSESISEFMIKLDVDDPEIEKEFYLIESQLKNQYIKILLNHYDEIIETLTNKTLTLEAIDYFETDPLIKCLYQAIYHFRAADDTIFDRKSPVEDLEYSKKWLKRHKSLLDYFFIYYEYNQLLKENREEYIEFIIAFEHYLEDALLRFSTGKYEMKIEKYKEKVKTLENNINHLEKIIDRKKNKNFKIRDEMKQLKEEHSMVVSKLKSEMLDIISETNDSIKVLEDELKRVKNETVTKEVYETKRKEAREYLKELNKVNQKYFELKNREQSFEVNLTTVEQYLKDNGMTKEFHQLISLYDDSIVTGKVSPYLIQRHYYKIGYVLIENNEHFFVDSTQEKFKLLSLPNEIYLENHQIIAVSKNNIFIKSYNQIFIDEIHEAYTLNEVASTQPLRVYGPNEKIISVNGTNELQEIGSIVRISKSQQIIGKSFKKTENSLSSITCSIKSKNHKLLYVEEKYKNGLLAYDLIENERVIFKKVFDVLEHSIITIENNELIKRFKYSKYLEDSKLLRNLSVGYYLEKGDHKWIEKINGSRLPLSEFQLRINHGLENGDVLGIDSFNNIVKHYTSEKVFELTDEQKIINYKRKNDTLTANHNTDYQILYEKVFLIVGNEKLGQRYIESFKENGIKADFVPGHESYYKIQSKANQCDEILFITTAASHTNFYNLKKDFFNKLTFINYQGVNRIFDYILEERL
ncbi:MAG TPA: hypothetical protein VJ962_09560 [Clostridia bacterium]|nr:hypothetical protein [Clostridia bacterium]